MRSDGRVFRADITGLRALAVIAVVLFHFEVPGFVGGFVGVDIFFVISGFLMTGIIVGALERRDFSIFLFYLSRIRRIVPALVIVCAVILFIGWWTLPVNDYKSLGKYTFASITFLSNFKYLKETGYFSPNAHDNFLLHTWSLSVEWQFYIFLPIFIIAAWRIKPQRYFLGMVLAAVGLASYLYCGFSTPIDSNAAFYLLPSRAWEMIAGGAVYLWGDLFILNGRLKPWLEASGFALALCCIALLGNNTIWPGWIAILPVASAVLVLLANRTSSPFTHNAVAQWIGLRSYSIYLWHWPIVVALNYGGQLGQTPATLCGLLATLFLGHFSYKWIELAATKQLSSRVKHPILWIMVSGVAVASIGLGVFWGNGIFGRLSKQADAISAGVFDKNPRNTECVVSAGNNPVKCIYGEAGPPRAIILGDSHAGALVSGLAKVTLALPDRPRSLEQRTFSACPTAEGVKMRFDNANSCGKFVDWALRELEDIPRDTPVVIANRHAFHVRGGNEDQVNLPQPQVYFSREYQEVNDKFIAEYTSHIVATACKISKKHPTYMVRPIPEMGVNIPNTSRGILFGRSEEITVSLAEYHTRNHFAWAAQDEAQRQCGVKILDPLPYLCWDGACHSLANGKPIYSDDNHLTQFGSDLLQPMFKSIF